MVLHEITAPTSKLTVQWRDPLRDYATLCRNDGFKKTLKDLFSFSTLEEPSEKESLLRFRDGQLADGSLQTVVSGLSIGDRGIFVDVQARTSEAEEVVRRTTEVITKFSTTRIGLEVEEEYFETSTTVRVPSTPDQFFSRSMRTFVSRSVAKVATRDGRYRAVVHPWFLGFKIHTIEAKPKNPLSPETHTADLEISQRSPKELSDGIFHLKSPFQYQIHCQLFESLLGPSED